MEGWDFRPNVGTEIAVHEDQDAACDNPKTTIRPAALRIRKAEFLCPVAIFEPPDPRSKPMYPKNLVSEFTRKMLTLPDKM